MLSALPAGSRPQAEIDYSFNLLSQLPNGLVLNQAALSFCPAYRAAENP